MKLKHILKNAEGIGLVEVMMGVAISGGLALTVAKLMENTSQNTKQNEAKSENINLKGMVQSNLSNTQACNYTFSPIITQANLNTLAANPNNSVTIPSVKNKVNAIAYSTASMNLNPLTISGITLTNYNSGTSTADLIIQSTFRRSSTQTQMVKPIRIPLNFNINNSVPSSPVLVGCSTMAVGGEWMLGGNSGTSEASDYLGTSDDEPLIFKVNAQKSGRIDNSSAGETSYGYQAQLSRTTSLYNTAFGYNALRSNTTGPSNVAIGYRALYGNTTAEGNTAIGHDSMFANSTGYDNTAIGAGTLRANTSGDNNIAIGREPLRANTTGRSNIALGNGAMMSNTTGAHNIGLGMAALMLNTTGSRNIAFGEVSSSRGTSASYNVALGYGALSYNIIGNQNVTVGNMSLYRNTGSNNTAIGHNAGYYTSADVAGDNNTFLGFAAGLNFTGGSRNVFIGANSGTTSGNDKLHINNGVSATSLIEGDFSSAGRFIKMDAKVGIGLGAGAVGTPSNPESTTSNTVRLHVKNGLTVLDQEDWMTLTLSSGWGPCTWPGAVAPSYFRDSVGVVHLKGCIKRTGTLPSYGATAFIMPAGYRASNHGSWQGPILRSADGSGPNGQEFCMLMHVFTSGEVAIYAGGSGNQFTSSSMVCHLTGLTWRADN